MKNGRKIALLMLPILVAYLFQATQYARAPVKYNYFVVYAKNADIALRPGNDLSPNGQTLLQNSTNQLGLYNLTLGQWGPGYRINYTDAFRIVNREAFAIRMIGFNFSSDSTGTGYLRIYVYNDTNNDGVGDTEVCVWDGSSTTLSSSNYIYFKAASAYGSDGGSSRVKIEIILPETGIDFQGQSSIEYSGTLYLWFTSA